MPDIKTALTKAIEQSKEKKMDKVGFPITTNVGRRTFYYVKANPGVNGKQITAWAKTQGLNPDSAYTVASQAARAGYMRKDENKGFHTLVPDYISIKANIKAKKKPAVVQAPKVEPIKTPELTTDYILSKLDVKQAFHLYKELMMIFTGHYK
jgi:hypothetical protein